MRKLAKIRKDYQDWAKAQRIWNARGDQLRAWSTPVKTVENIWVVAGELCLPREYVLTARYFHEFASQYTRREEEVRALQRKLRVGPDLIW